MSEKVERMSEEEVAYERSLLDALQRQADDDQPPTPNMIAQVRKILSTLDAARSRLREVEGERDEERAMRKGAEHRGTSYLLDEQAECGYGRPMGACFGASEMDIPCNPCAMNFAAFALKEMESRAVRAEAALERLVPMCETVARDEPLWEGFGEAVRVARAALERGGKDGAP